MPLVVCEKKQGCYSLSAVSTAYTAKLGTSVAEAQVPDDNDTTVFYSVRSTVRAFVGQGCAVDGFAT